MFLSLYHFCAIIIGFYLLWCLCSCFLAECKVSILRWIHTYSSPHTAQVLNMSDSIIAKKEVLQPISFHFRGKVGRM